MQWRCPRHGTDTFGFAFLCSHLEDGGGTGFNLVLDANDENELQPPAICDECEMERSRSGGYGSSRLCAICYDEIKARQVLKTGQ